MDMLTHWMNLHSSVTEENGGDADEVEHRASYIYHLVPPKLMALNRTWGMKDDNDFKGGQGVMEDELQWEVQIFEILEKTKPVCLKCRCKVNGVLTDAA